MSNLTGTGTGEHKAKSQHLSIDFPINQGCKVSLVQMARYSVAAWTKAKPILPIKHADNNLSCRINTLTTVLTHTNKYTHCQVPHMHRSSASSPRHASQQPYYKNPLQKFSPYKEVERNVENNNNKSAKSPLFSVIPLVLLDSSPDFH